MTNDSLPLDDMIPLSPVGLKPTLPAKPLLPTPPKPDPVPKADSPLKFETASKPDDAPKPDMKSSPSAGMKLASRIATATGIHPTKRFATIAVSAGLSLTAGLFAMRLLWPESPKSVVPTSQAAPEAVTPPLMTPTPEAAPAPLAENTATATNVPDMPRSAMESVPTNTAETPKPVAVSVPTSTPPTEPAPFSIPVASSPAIAPASPTGGMAPPAPQELFTPPSVSIAPPETTPVKPMRQAEVAISREPEPVFVPATNSVKQAVASVPEFPANDTNRLSVPSVVIPASSMEPVVPAAPPAPMTTPTAPTLPAVPGTLPAIAPPSIEPTAPASLPAVAAPGLPPGINLPAPAALTPPSITPPALTPAPAAPPAVPDLGSPPVAPLAVPSPKPEVPALSPPAPLAPPTLNVPAAPVSEPATMPLPTPAPLVDPSAPVQGRPVESTPAFVPSAPANTLPTAPPAALPSAPPSAPVTPDLVVPETKPMTESNARSIPPAASTPLHFSKPAGGSDARPASSAASSERPAKTDYDVGLHEPRANETYESISEEWYNTKKLAAALRAYNRNKALQGQGAVEVPPIDVLRRSYPQFASSDGRMSSAAPTSSSSEWKATGFDSPAHRSVGAKEYVVPTGGMTMREVARVTLGRDTRWGELYELNPEITNPGGILPAGTRLRLP